MKPSTKMFIREARKKSMSGFDLLHGYVYIRWPYFYIALGKGRHWLARLLAPLVIPLGKWMVANSNRLRDDRRIGFEDTYHGKVVPLDAARQLVSVKEDIQLGDLEKIIPYARAREIVLQNPEQIVVLDCPCRMASENPCLPLDVCLIIGEPFASLVIEHHPDRSRRISSQEAQVILQEEDRRGHVHHAFFKDAMLGRFYAICNCCSCCCGAMQAQRNGVQMLAPSGYVAQVKEEVCEACHVCEKTCPFSAIHMDGNHAVVDFEKCMGCGICVNACRFQAITLERAESKGIPLEINELIERHFRI